MGTLALDLQAALDALDAESRSKLERLVRDAIDLAQPKDAKAAEMDARGWPVGHFEKYVGCLAGDDWNPPADPPPEPTPS